jgi:hypothetical protein
MTESLVEVCRLDASPQEIAYLILQADIGVKAANARIDCDRDALIDCLKQLIDAAMTFDANHGPAASAKLLERMSALIGARV